MTEMLVLVILLVLGVFCVFAPDLKAAIIGMGIFGMWMSLAYLFYHAPDVAIAEAVIASSLGTILFVITLRSYKDTAVQITPKTLLRGWWIEIFALAAIGMVVYLSAQTQTVGRLELFYLVMEDYSAMNRIVNTVPNILLNYRIFDTIFEALMLLVSGIGVAHLIKHRREEELERRN